MVFTNQDEGIVDIVQPIIKIILTTHNLKEITINIGKNRSKNVDINHHILCNLNTFYSFPALVC